MHSREQVERGGAMERWHIVCCAVSFLTTKVTLFLLLLSPFSCFSSLLLNFVGVNCPCSSSTLEMSEPFLLW